MIRLLLYKNLKTLPINKKPKVFFQGRVSKPEELCKINEKIEAKTVRVVGDGIENQVCGIDTALQLAREAGLDLVEISPNSNPGSGISPLMLNAVLPAGISPRKIRSYE